MLGEKIKELRKISNLSQQELAEKLFVSDKTISSWEQNRTEPSLDFIVKMCNIFNVSVSSLIFENVEKSNIETEIKIKLEKQKFDELKKFLDTNSTFIDESRQIDTYYEPSYRKFVSEDINKTVYEWLRIGKRGNKIILNYKKWDCSDKYCDEYEVEIDNDNNLDKIFKVLGIYKLIVVDKTRRKYLYLNKYEISLDYVNELGYFIEIEVKKYDKPIMEEYDNLIEISKSLKLNLANIDKRGYPYHMIELNKKK